jgi:hypothetical protein
MIADSRRLWRQLLLALMPFAVLVLAVSALWRNNLVLTLLMIVELGIVLGIWHDRRDLSFLLVIGGMGSLAEAAFVRAGAWHYANPSFLGIPAWFPFAFGTAGLCGGRIARSVAALWEAWSASRPPCVPGP